MSTSHSVEKTVKKSGVKGRGGVSKWVYGPSLGRSVEFGASAGAGGGKEERVGKLVGMGGGAEG
jgi:hypothetical protein